MPDSSGMRRRPRSISAVVLASAGTLLAAAVATPGASAALTGPQQIEALNAQRAKHGIPAGIVEVPTWSAACKKHMDYLAATRKFQHHEDAADPQYSGEGNWGGTHSVLVSAGDAFGAGGGNAFEHAPIHLMQMLSPFITRSGADRGCLVTLGDADPLEKTPSTERVFAAPQTFSYPGNAVTDVPVSEDTFEWPFVPAASVGLNVPGDVTRSRETGPHLYVFYGGPSANPGPQSWWSRGVITAASLTGPAGAVEVKTVDNATAAPPSIGGSLGGYLAPGGIVIPVKPLTAGTTYAASVTYDPNGADPVTHNWSFTTAGTAPSQPTRTTTWTTNPFPGQEIPSQLQQPLPPIGPPTITKLKLQKRSVTFDATGDGALWATIEQQTRPKKGKKPAKWAKRRSLPVSSVTGENRLSVKKLAKGKYRVRVRDASATGKILLEKTFTL